MFSAPCFRCTENVPNHDLKNQGTMFVFLYRYTPTFQYYY